ncbi:hypothetical protein, partial [Xenorhabdus innexi]
DRRLTRPLFSQEHTMIYTQGTISTVSGSAFVRGTGTQFKSNLNGVAPGQVILIQSGSSNLLHMIQAVNSDTELVLADKATVTLNKVTYQIQTTVPNSISDGVRHLCAINSHIITFLQNMDKWMSQNGTVDVTLPNGQTVSLQSIKALQAAVGGKLDKAQNGADIPDKSAFVSNVGLSHVLRVGDYGLGKGSVELSPGQTIASLAGKTGFYSKIVPPLPSDVPKGDGAVKVLSMGVAGWATQLAFDAYRNIAWIRARKSWGSDFQDWGQFLILGANCYRDDSGYIRQGSPILQIHPDGNFTTNDESEGATVTKRATGHYQVTGVLGYNADKAWGVHGGISSPKNNNGLELIYIDDKVNKDGSITIETFHRQHSHLPERFQNKRIKALIDGEKVYYQDGEPCDIPEGCRLDVRVQMPENSVWNLKQASSGEE